MSAREMREYDRLIIRTPDTHTHTHTHTLRLRTHTVTSDVTGEVACDWLTGLDDVVSQADDECVRPVCLELLPELLQHLVELGQVTCSHRWTAAHRGPALVLETTDVTEHLIGYFN